jgi:hypothetical protein
MNYLAVISHARHVASCFNDPILLQEGQSSGISTSIRLVALMDYVEKIALWAMTPPAPSNSTTAKSSRSATEQHASPYNVRVFLEECFKFDSFLNTQAIDDFDAEQQGGRIEVSIPDE